MNMAIIDPKNQEDSQKKWSETEIAGALAREYFDLRKNFVCVQNVSFGFLNWEADLLVCSKNGFLTEVEIKVSAADWKKDHTKDKWRMIKKSEADNKPTRMKYFYYCAPKPLAERYKEFEIPEWAGVIEIDYNSSHGRYSFQVLKQAVERINNRKMTTEEMLKLARLGSMRAWSR